jgi:hypothetical protein
LLFPFTFILWREIEKNRFMPKCIWAHIDIRNQTNLNIIE